jgi:hypothetical protein
MLESNGVARGVLALGDVATAGDFFAVDASCRIPGHGASGRSSSLLQYFCGTNRRFAIEATSS